MSAVVPLHLACLELAWTCGLVTSGCVALFLSWGLVLIFPIRLRFSNLRVIYSLVLANEKVMCGPVIGHREAFGSLCPALARPEAIGDFPRRGFGSRRSLLYARPPPGAELPLTVARRL